MRKLSVLLGLLFFLWPYDIAAAETVKVNGKSCAYSVEVPESWGIIPKDSVNAKFGEDLVDIALYCKQSNTTFFQGMYILYSFMPTSGTLNQLDFAEITKEIKQGFEVTNNSQSSDKAKVITDTFLADNGNLSFQITGTVILEKKKRKFYQTIIPAKFGYLMIAAYQASDLSAQSCDLSTHDFSHGLVIDNNFKYTEPPSKFNLNLFHLFIALAVSSTVYGVIQYSPKIKALLRKKEGL